MAIERGGAAEDAWFDLALSPIRNAPHGIGGLLLCLSETSERVRTETRLSQTALHYKQAPRCTGRASSACSWRSRPAT